MSATKYDYRAIAEAVRAAGYYQWITPGFRNGAEYMRAEVCNLIADHFAKNPKFDRAQFLRDCGVES